MNSLSEAIAYRYKKARIRSERASFFKKVLFIAVIIFVLFNTFFGVTRIRDDVNSPNLKLGDIVFYFKQNNYVNEDMIVYKERYKDDTEFIGRIKALKGTVIDATSDLKLTINGNIQPIDKAKNIFYEAHVASPDPYPFTIQKNQYFVLSDARGSGLDSRYFGPIDKSAVKGKIFFVLRKTNI